jgi:hypothetical protein
MRRTITSNYGPEKDYVLSNYNLVRLRVANTLSKLSAVQFTTSRQSPP